MFGLLGQMKVVALAGVAAAGIAAGAPAASAHEHFSIGISLPAIFAPGRRLCINSRSTWHRRNRALRPPCTTSRPPSATSRHRSTTSQNVPITVPTTSSTGPMTTTAGAARVTFATRVGSGD